MKGTKAAGRYALSLIDLASEQSKLEEVKDDMALIAATIAENRDLELMLQSPIIKSDQKQAVLTSVFEKSIQKLTLSFITMVTAKGRENLVLSMANAFLEIYKERNGIVTAHVTTAVPLSKEERDRVSKTLASLGKTVELIETVDADLIGGMKVRVGDRRIDASLRKKLNELKHDIHYS